MNFTSMNRRDLLKIAGLTILPTSSLLSQEITEDKSVIWLYLGGGASHFETFHAKPGTSDEYSSVIGELHDPGTGIILGGLFTNLITHADKLNVVANFSHGDSAHLQATHFVNTGHFNSERTQTASQKYPGHGSIVSVVYGTNRHNGMPTYVATDKIAGEDPVWLGGNYKPFDPSAKNNLTPRVALDRFEQRKVLLDGLDRSFANDRVSDVVDGHKQQAFNVILGEAKNAFDIQQEDPKLVESYGKGLGEKLLLSRRLIERGTKWVSVNYGGWDMHQNIKQGLESRVPELDNALATLVADIWARGLNEKTMIIVTTEFGRTKLNKTSGRDHWSNLVPLLMIGGSYRSGRVIGETDKYNYSPEGSTFKPIDLQATIFDHYGIDKRIQKTDLSGRPRYLLDGEYHEIL